MSKRTHFTTVTALPAGITRETVLQTLHNHVEMIDLNPLVTERHPIRPPPEATAEEYHCQWYSVTDKVNYLPGGLYSGSVTFHGCFHDLPDGLQTHIYAPMGLDMKGRWTLGGSLPGEPRQATELGLGVPKTGLWLREDVNMKVNIVMTKFVKGTTKKTHAKLVQRLVEKAHLAEAQAHNSALSGQHRTSMASPTVSTAAYYEDAGRAAMSPPDGQQYHYGRTEKSPPYFDHKTQPLEYANAQISHADARGPYPQFELPLYDNSNHYAAELPSHDQRTPVEMEDTQR